MCTHTHLFGEFAVLVNVSDLLAAEVGGGLCAGAAVDGRLGVAAVVVAVAGGRLALVHGVVLGRPLQRRVALGAPAKGTVQNTHTEVHTGTRQ